MKFAHALLILALLGGCQVVGPESDTSDIISNDADWSIAHRDAYRIEEIQIRNHTLFLDVSYSGGCEKHTFDLHASPDWIKTNPPGKDIIIAHDAHGDACEAYLTGQLKFDLKELQNPQSSEVVLFIWPFPGDSVWTPAPRYRY